MFNKLKFLDLSFMNLLKKNFLSSQRYLLTIIILLGIYIYIYEFFMSKLIVIKLNIKNHSSL